MAAPLPMFLPISESAQGAVFLPGLAGDPHSQTQAMFPPGTYPIMGSGEYTGTLYPLADPVPPQPMPLPPEVQPVAMPAGLGSQGLPPVEMPQPMPQEILAIPPGQGAELPGAQPLAMPLPTAVPPIQQAFPPWPQQLPQVYNEPPQQLPMPQVGLEAALPSPMAGEPIAITQEPGILSLRNALQSAREQAADLAANTDGRNVLRAGIPEPNTGQLVWEHTWGG